MKLCDKHKISFHWMNPNRLEIKRSHDLATKARKEKLSLGIDLL